MGYSAITFLLGAVLIVYGVLAGRWYLLVIWLGADFLVLSCAYYYNVSRVFGKRSNGTLPVWSLILFGPMHLFTAAIWHLIRLSSREPTFQEITTRLTIGRRLLSSEVQREYDNYVDLTAEFVEPRKIRSSASYLNFPILDGSAPDAALLHRTIEKLRPGSTYIHCAQGHGRTGLFALAVLLSSGKVQSVDEGLRLLTTVRPQITLNKLQRRCADQFAEALRSGIPASCS